MALSMDKQQMGENRMKVIVEQTAGVDYPVEMKGDEKFYERQRTVVRARLQLRASDVIEIREVQP